MAIIAVLGASFTALALNLSSSSQAHAAPLSVTPVQSSWHASPLTYMIIGDGNTPQRAAAYQTSLMSCLSSRGWGNSPIPSVLSPTPPNTIGALSSYRAAYGYGDGTNPPSVGSITVEQAKANVDSFMATLTPTQQSQYMAALDGNDGQDGPAASTVGCEASATEAANADLPVENDSFRAAYGAELQAMVSNPQMQQASQAWASCMKTQGYPGLGSPGEMVRTYSDGVGSAPNVPVELKAAKADFGCQLTTVLPVEHAFEMQAVAALARSFPQYADRVSS